MKFIHCNTSIKGGSKYFLEDGSIKGHYFPIGEVTHTICICEGYSTGASIAEAPTNSRGGKPSLVFTINPEFTKEW